MKKKYQSEIMEVLHGMAEDLHEIGAISDARMAEYDHDCLVRKPDKIHKTKKTNPIPSGSRPVTPVFAKHKA
jgi:DNA-binding transcriptional regulator YiaG